MSMKWNQKWNRKWNMKWNMKQGMKLSRKHGNKTKRENNLGTDDIRKLVPRIALPAMLAQFVNVLYSIVDRMYIGNIPLVGETALAGVGICGPIVTMISAFAAWIGIGGAPLMSIKMGEKNQAGAEKILANCFILLLGMAVIITAAGFLAKDRLLVAFGATESIFPFANTYMSIYIVGTVFAILALGLNQFIICQGYSGLGMCSVVIGAVCNIILDSVFIFGMQMGVAGAALATVVSQAASCAFTLFILFGKRVPVRINFSRYMGCGRKKMMEFSICARVLVLGLTPFLIILFDNVLIIIQNIMLKEYGGGDSDLLLTCNTIVQSFMLMITMPLSGISGGTQSILGYNYGAGNSGRIKLAEKQIMKTALIFCSIMFVLAQVGARFFVIIFTREPQYLEMTQYFIRIYTLGVIPLAVQYVFVDGLTGMGIARVALPLSFIRKGIYIGLVVFLSMNMGAAKMFWAEPVSDAVAPVITAVAYGIMIPRILSARENEVKLHFAGKEPDNA